MTPEFIDNVNKTLKSSLKEEIKTYLHKNNFTRMFTVALFIIAWEWKHPTCASVGEWIDKLWCVHTDNELVIYPTTLDKSQKARQGHAVWFLL